MAGARWAWRREKEERERVCRNLEREGEVEDDDVAFYLWAFSKYFQKLHCDPVFQDFFQFSPQKLHFDPKFLKFLSIMPLIFFINIP